MAPKAVMGAGKGSPAAAKAMPHADPGAGAAAKATPPAVHFALDSKSYTYIYIHNIYTHICIHTL
jgi:hypothetical protein